MATKHGKKILLRQVISWLMCLTLCLGFMPMAALADEGEKPVVTFAGIEGKVTQAKPGDVVDLSGVTAADSEGSSLSVSYSVSSTSPDIDPQVAEDKLTVSGDVGMIFTVLYSAHAADDTVLATQEYRITVIESETKSTPTPAPEDGNTGASAGDASPASGTDNESKTPDDEQNQGGDDLPQPSASPTGGIPVDEPKGGEPEDGDSEDGESKDGDSEDGEPKDGDSQDGEPENSEGEEVLLLQSGENGISLQQIDGVGPMPEGDEVYLTKFAFAVNPNDGTLNGFGVKDGTAPWDNDNNPGNDVDAANFIVRTFDTVTYSLEYSTSVHEDATYAYYDQAYLWLEITLPFSAKNAQVDLEAMSWLENATTTVSGDGNTQVVTGRYKLVHKEGITSSVPGSGTLEVPINIYNMENGTHINPTFRAWMDGNDTVNANCERHPDIQEVKSITNGDVKVSSAPSYNVQLKPVSASYVGGLMNYDFTTGNEQAFNVDAGNAVNGRLTGYGVTLQLYNSNPDKCLRGIEYPVGPITITLELKSNFRPSGMADIDVTDEYQPLVWSQGENKPAVADDGRAYPSSCVSYAVGAAPGANRLGGQGVNNYCYNSGDWQGSQDGKTVTITISDYEIDGSSFPNADLGNGWNSNIYFDYRTGVRNKGCFSGGKIFVVQPFYNNGKGDGEKNTYILDDKEALNLETVPGSGDFYTSLTVTGINVHAKSTGTETAVAAGLANVVTTDDTKQVQVYLSRPGTYDTRVNYGYRGRADYGYDIQNVYGGDGAYANGKDWATVGASFALRWGCVYNASGSSANVSYAADSLIKFDPTAIELDPSYTRFGDYSDTAYGYTCTYLYGAKEDGGAWTGDAELDSSGMKDLVFYNSLTELKAAGKICLAVLAQFRRTDTSKPECTIQSLTLSCLMGAKIKNDQDLIGNFYMINTETYQWNKGQYEAICAQNDGVFPSQIDPETRAEFAALSIGSSADQMAWHGYPSYVKETLDPETEDYVYPANHRGSYQYGDSVQIIGAVSNIIKQVEQVQGSGTTPKDTYNLGDDQRYVDWILTPGLKVENNKEVVGEAMKTYIVITDTIPAGLTYKPLSAYWGGTYTQAEKAGRMGTVTGGTQIPLLTAEPTNPSAYKCYMTLVDNANKSTTMTIRINDLPVGTEIDPVHYTTEIGTADNPRTDVENNQSFTNTVKISTPVDKRTINKGNGTISEAGMKVIKLAAVSLQKYPVNKINERTNNLTYTLITANNAALVINKNMIIDRMPFDGDTNGSVITNGYTLNSLSIDKACLGTESLGALKVYGTTDTKYRDVTTYPDSVIERNSFRDTEVVTWTSLPVDPATGTVDVSPLSGTQPVMIAVVGPLEPGEIHRVTLEIKPNNPLVSDIYVNKLTAAGTSTSAKAEFATRNLSGLAWYDKDQNGQRDSGEAIFAGVGVSLFIWDKNTETYVDTGRSTTTDAQGNYSFTGLDAGEYEVRFHDISATSGLGVTGKDATANDLLDCDASEQLNAGGTDRAYAAINGIQMPTAADMDSKNYESVHNDVGYTNTLWVSNETKNNKGGSIQVSGFDDTKGTVSSDGNDDNTVNRKPANTVLATPDTGWAVDLDNLKVQGQTVTLKSDGTFEVTVAGVSYKGKVTTDSTGKMALVVTNFAESQKNVDVGVKFVPTIWVENTTIDDENGKVQVTGDDNSLSNTDSGARQVKNSVTGIPEEGFLPDMSNITVNKKTITPNTDGSFSVTDDAGNLINGTAIMGIDGKLVVTITNMEETPVDVGISFVPSIWVANNTKNNSGGKVEVDGYSDTQSKISSDGADDNGKNRKTAKSVSATPDAQWQVDLTNITVNDTLIDGFAEDGSFSITDADNNTITGKVTVDTNGKATVELDELAVPTDIQIGFVPTIWIENATEEDEHGTVQVVGVESSIGTADSGPRQPHSAVKGNPEADYTVDLKSITVNKKVITPNDDGKFTVIDDSGKTITGKLTTAEDGSATVTIDDMATPVDVAMKFIPSIWAANNTEDNAGGKVQVVGFDDTLNTISSDGEDNRDKNRKPSKSVWAIPDEKWQVDLTNITVNDTLIDGFAEDGSFTVIDADSNTITGKVTVDTNGKATVELDELTVPTDIQIGFVPTIWIENATDSDKHGTVQVDGDDSSIGTADSGPRQPHNAVKGKPESGYVVDISDITVNKKVITPNDDGNFTVIDDSGKTITGKLTTAEDGSATVTVDDMASPVDVAMKFVPTIWVANNTANNAGGKVQVDGFGDTVSCVSSDGEDKRDNNRKNGKSVSATPDEQWQVDLTSITVNDTVIESIAEDGSFTVIDADNNTITGKVTVDTDGKATVELNELAVPADIQMGFVPTIWIENATEEDEHGTVQVEGDDSSISNADSGDRQPRNAVRGKPEPGFVVDMSKIRVNGKTITPNANGSFTFTDDGGSIISGTVTMSKDGSAAVTFNNPTTPIDVSMVFVPSLWVENSTKDNLGGIVQAEGFGDTVSRISSDGEDVNTNNRKNTKSASATPDTGWEVDTENIRINNIRLIPDENMRFSITDQDGTPIAGQIIKGKGGKVIVMLDNLEVPVDVSIPFSLVPKTSPTTGDKENLPLYCLLMTLSTVGLGVCLKPGRRKSGADA